MSAMRLLDEIHEDDECDCEQCQDSNLAQAKPVRNEMEMKEMKHPKSVLEWRRDEFRRLGFKAAQADLLAASRVDLHQAEQLLKRGCAHKYAIRILGGTCFAGDDELAPKRHTPKRHTKKQAA